MKVNRIILFTKVMALLVVSIGMVVSAAKPADARPTDGIDWAQCNGRRTVKSKNITRNGKLQGSLYIYRCDNGIYARVKSENKRDTLVTLRRSNPASTLKRKQVYGYQAMTEMLYIKGGACYAASGWISNGGSAELKYCI